MTAFPIQSDLIERREIAASQAYVPVAVETLVPSAAHGFDLYLRQSRTNSYVLYRRNGYPLSDEDVRRLTEQDVRTLHILFDDRNAYAEHLNRLLLESHSLTSVEKYNILKGAARSLLLEQFSGNLSESSLQPVNTLSQQMVESICSDDMVLRDMFFLMAHDYQSYTHATNVSTYCLTIARGLGIHDLQELVAITTGALLHDIGKRHLPPDLLNKGSRLTRKENSLFQRHPQLGFEELCLRTDLSWGQLMMVYQHHERVDGAGYPVQVCGDEMHLWARICAVADAFDALTSDRSYRRAVPLGAALEFISQRAGKAFDKEIVKCLIHAMSSN
jgi:HD-GYP domain-containing protein (c-di-GMP phosphodiesterase class II)